jgi:hypothetical protein
VLLDVGGQVGGSTLFQSKVRLCHRQAASVMNRYNVVTALSLWLQVFETTMATLCKEPHSVLARTAFHHVQSLRRADARAAAVAALTSAGASTGAMAALDGGVGAAGATPLGGAAGSGTVASTVGRVEASTQVPERPTEPLPGPGTPDRSLFIDRDW